MTASDPLSPGDGTVARDIAAVDWSATPLGPPEGWPRALHGAVRLVLGSRFAMWMAWGPELTMFYNDAYRHDTLRRRHPWALGRPTAEVWAEIWDDIRPRVDRVLDGASTWDEDLLLFLERNDYPEETYHTFSYSPLVGDDDAVEGLLCVVSETTDRVLGDRRLSTLRDLAAAVSGSRTADTVVGRALAELGRNREDLPFVLLHLLEGDGTSRPAGAVGAAADSRLAARAWPVDRVREGARFVLDLEPEPGEELPTGAWSRPPGQVVVVPLAAGDDEPAGFLVVGPNPHRELDAQHLGFLDLVGTQIGAGLSVAAGYEAERRRAEALLALDRAKTDFFANVSHEFRTPLTLIMGPVEDLRAAPEVDPQRWRAELDVVHRNGQRLGRLVSHLLDFSRLQAGRATSRFVPTDLAALTADLAGVFRSAMDRAGLAFEVDCTVLPEPVYVDRDAWERVVLNLLSNALKFTLTGSVTLRLGPDRRPAGSGSGPGSVELAVTDTGAGIPAAELPRLFERFHRVEGTPARSGEGSGIGLAMVQELVVLHGGTIGATSTPGVGTTVTVRVPGGRGHLPADQVAEAATEVPDPAAAAEPFLAEALEWLPGARGTRDGGTAEIGPGEIGPQPDGADLRGDRVLVVDDNADMRAYLVRLLAPHHRVRAVADGVEALAAIRADPPDLVLSDVMMPRLDGMGLLAAIRADPRTERLPVVLLSARAGQEAAVEGLAAQADDYLVKPFSSGELLARVSVRLELGRTRRSAEVRFTAMADLAPALIWVDDAEQRRVFVNSGWRRFTGRGTGEELGTGWAGGVHPEDRDRRSGTVAAAVDAALGWEVEYRLRRHDGTYHWVVEQAVPLPPPGGGDPTGWVGTCVDVHARHRESDRQRLLAEVGAELDAVVTVEDRLARLVRLLHDARLADRAAARPLAGATSRSGTAVGALDGPVGMSLEVPLVARGRHLAVVALERREGSPGWSAEDRALVAEVLARAALSVDNALLLAEERAAVAQVVLLQRATAELSAAATPRQVADVAARHLGTLLASPATVAVYEYDPTTAGLGVLVRTGTGTGTGSGTATGTATGSAPGTGAGAGAGRRTAASTRSLVGDAVAAGTPIWLDDPEAAAADGPVDAARLRALDAAGVRGAIALPLVVGGRTVGAIEVGFARPRLLSAGERATLLALADPCALALDRARLYRAEHRIAATLQQSLLPQQLPELDGLALAARYSPGAEGTRAGGDWYDVVELDAGRVAVAVGDVVGQGAPAAAVMGQLRTALSGYLLAGLGPSAALELLDRLAARVPGARASTAACVVLDLAGGELRWARAGHLPVLLVDSDGARPLDGRAGHGALLGLAGRPPYTEGFLRVEPGTSLVLYTDGLVERRGETLDEGLDRLAAAAGRRRDEAPEPLVAGLLADLAEPGGHADDVAVIVARIVPAALTLARPAVPEELRRIRRAVAGWAALAALTDVVVEDLQLALGEAATNAVEHAYPDPPPAGGPEPTVEVRVARRRDGAVVAAVTDHGTWRPVPADPGHRGRGLELIRGVTRDVEVAASAGGTTVRFVLPAPDAEVPAAAGDGTDPAAGDGNGAAAGDGNGAAAGDGADGVARVGPATGRGAAVEVVPDGPGTWIVVRGEVDAASVADVRGPVLDTVRDAAARSRVVVDLRGVTHFASAGVGLIAEAVLRGEERDVAVLVRTDPGDPAARVLAVAGSPAPPT